MTASVQAIASEALKLSAEERAELIETLIASVEIADSLHPDWEAEIARRLDDLEGGRTSLIPGGQVLAEIRALIESRKDRA